jgi:hypothetical protein
MITGLIGAQNGDTKVPICLSIYPSFLTPVPLLPCVVPHSSSSPSTLLSVLLPIILQSCAKLPQIIISSSHFEIELCNSILTYHPFVLLPQQIYVTFPVRPSGPGAALSGKEAMFEGTYAQYPVTALQTKDIR